MTEEIAAAPGWVESRLDEAFSGLPSSIPPDARDRYAQCLAAAKQPAAPSDLLGAEFDRCRAQLMTTMAGTGAGQATLDVLAKRLEALEAELAADS